jgi:Ca2+-dependent lipid-binding protein
VNPTSAARQCSPNHFVVDLPDKHTFSKQDPYAQIALADKTHRTNIDVKGGQHPVWDEEIRVKVPREGGSKNRTLEVSCWAKEPRGDDLLGKGSIDITETLKTGEFDGTSDYSLHFGRKLMYWAG